jgi:hypothetical protein
VRRNSGERQGVWPGESVCAVSQLALHRTGSVCDRCRSALLLQSELSSRFCDLGAGGRRKHVGRFRTQDPLYSFRDLRGGDGRDGDDQKLLAYPIPGRDVLYVPDDRARLAELVAVRCVAHPGTSDLFRLRI